MTVSLLRRTAFLLALSITLSLSAQDSEPLVPLVLNGPPPAQIASAHNIFLSSAGTSPNFPIDSTRAYNDVYERLRTWGHYNLVPSAAQADLVLELRGVAPITSINGTDGATTSYTSPAFQLTIVDSKTDRPIWRITSPVVLAGSKKTYDHWVSLSETNLVSRLQVLAGVPLSETQSASLTTVPKNHRALIGVIALSGAIGLGVGGGLLLHHFYENSLADQKASQDAFCKANNIPLSMCAGG